MTAADLADALLERVESLNSRSFALLTRADLDALIAAATAEARAGLGPRSMETVRGWMGLDVWMSLGRDAGDYPGWTADVWSDMMAAIRAALAEPEP